MGRHASYKITLTQEEWNELEGVTRRGSLNVYIVVAFG